MKFFHLSDLHIGLRLYNREMYEDQEYVFAQICQAARREQPDGIVIAGDIYDKAVPSAEAVQVFSRLVDSLVEAVPEAVIMMVSGNHDSAPRLDVFRSVLRQQKIHMIGQPPRKPEERMAKVTLRDDFGPVNFYLLPFVKPSMVREIVGCDENGNNLSYNAAIHSLIQRENVDTQQRNVLVSHQFYLPAGQSADSIARMDSEIRTVGNIDEVKADVLEQFDYAALGHIHKPMKVGSECIRYCGTPLPCSVSEAGQEKSILMVELGKKGEVQVTPLPLQPLHSVRVVTGLLAEVLKQGCDDYVSVVLTDRDDLDVLDMQDRLRQAFPNLLEIRRDVLFTQSTELPDMENEDMDAYSLCEKFLGDWDPRDSQLLREIINEVQEEKE